MAELTTRERLLPYLLDRLTNDHPAERQESLTGRTWTLRQSHAAIVRDLGWLLNSACRPSWDSLEDLPEVSKSVLNYGMPDLSGLTAAGITAERIERMLLQAIQRFEPRIQRQGLTVRVVEENRPGQTNTLTLEIRGDIWATPMPDALYLKTELDLESGQCVLKDTPYG